MSTETDVFVNAKPCACGRPKPWGVALVEPGEEICSDCREEARERGRRLADFGRTMPLRYAIGFEEPRAWPVDPRKPDASLAAWNGTPWSVHLHGPVGTGKTMLAVELLRRLVAAGERSIEFVRAGEIPGRLYQARDADERARLGNVAALLIDDLGAGHPGNAWAAVGEVIAARYDRLRPTIVTSNLSLKAVGLTDLRIADRLGVGLSVELKGKSRRG